MTLGPAPQASGNIFGVSVSGILNIVRIGVPNTLSGQLISVQPMSSLNPGIFHMSYFYGKTITVSEYWNMGDAEKIYHMRENVKVNSEDIYSSQRQTSWDIREFVEKFDQEFFKKYRILF